MRISDRYERFTDRVSTTKTGASDKSQKAGSKPAAESPTLAGEPGVMSVQVSPQAASLAAGTARLEQLREQVRNGTFKVDAKDIADKLVGEEG